MLQDGRTHPAFPPDWVLPLSWVLPVDRRMCISWMSPWEAAWFSLGDLRPTSSFAEVKALVGQFCRGVACDVGQCDIVSSLPEARGEILILMMDNVNLTDHVSFALNIRSLAPNVWSVFSVESITWILWTNLIHGPVLLHNLDFSLPLYHLH